MRNHRCDVATPSHGGTLIEHFARHGQGQTAQGTPADHVGFKDTELKAGLGVGDDGANDCPALAFLRGGADEVLLAGFGQCILVCLKIGFVSAGIE